MTKFAFLTILFFLSQHLEAQSVDYCDYFFLDVSADEYNGKFVNSYSPEIIHSGQDAFSKFLRSHENRFSYILWNKVDSLEEMSSIYPDTFLLKRKFCNSVFGNNRLLGYFVDLTPRKMTRWESKHIAFSMDEMMKVASKFFYVSKINLIDTTVERKICVGMNGQDRYSAGRDLTLLEAFTFEAIFYYLLKNNAPLFETDFREYSVRSLGVNKNKYPSIDALLSAIRNECYEQMSKNEDLKDSLTRYYRKNRNNLNFEIAETGI